MFERMRSRLPGRNYIVPAILGIAIVWQLTVTMDTYALRYLRLVGGLRSFPAEYREAYLFLGRRGATYVSFLKAIVPPDAAVVLPEGPFGGFTQQNILQYFLMPRRVPSCGCQEESARDDRAECEVCLAAPHHFVPALGEFPLDGTAPTGKRLVPFQYVGGSEWYRGVYVPDTYVGPRAVPLAAEPVPLASWMRAAAVDLALYLSILAVGVLASWIILGERDPWAAAIVGLPVGVGLITWLTFLLAWARGGSVNLALSLSVVTILIPVLLLWARRLGLLRRPSPTGRRSSPGGSRSVLNASSTLTLVASGLLAVIVVVAATISVGRGYSQYDDIANWALKGHAVAEFESLFAGRDWGGHGLSYPMNIPLFIALFRSADGDLLPGSKLLFPAMLLCLCWGLFRGLTQEGAAPHAAMLTAALVASTPTVFMFATLGYGNFPFATYFFLGVMFTISGVARPSHGEYRMGVVLLGLAAWTRPEGVGFAVVLLAGLLIAALASRRLHREHLAGLIPFVLLVLPWALFSLSSLAGDEIGGLVRLATASIARGQLGLDQLARAVGYALSRFLPDSVWGVLPLLLVLLAVGSLARRRRPLKWAEKAWIVASSVTLVTTFAMFYAAGFDQRNMITFLDYSFDRAMMPSAIVSTFAAVIVLGSAVQGMAPPVGAVSPPPSTTSDGHGALARPGAAP